MISILFQINYLSYLQDHFAGLKKKNAPCCHPYSLLSERNDVLFKSSDKNSSVVTNISCYKTN